MQEASDALSKTADSDTVSTYQVSSVQLVTDLPPSGSSIDPPSVMLHTTISLQKLYKTNKRKD